MTPYLFVIYITSMITDYVYELTLPKMIVWRVVKYERMMFKIDREFISLADFGGVALLAPDAWFPDEGYQMPWDHWNPQIRVGKMGRGATPMPMIGTSIKAHRLHWPMDYIDLERVRRSHGVGFVFTDPWYQEPARLTRGHCYPLVHAVDGLIMAWEHEPDTIHTAQLREDGLITTKTLFWDRLIWNR